MNTNNSIKILNIKQGTDEWLSWRSKGIGSSDAASIVDLSPYKTKYRLWLEKTGQVSEKDLSFNFNVQRGNALEQVARREFNNKIGVKYEPILFEDVENNFLRFSSDGFNPDDNSFIEIKCPNIENHSLYIYNKKIPDHYMIQIQYGLMVSKCDYAYFISYNINHDDQLFYIKVQRDEKIIDDLFIKTVKFWDGVVNLIQPSLSNKDKVIIQDDNFKNLAFEYRNLYFKIKELEDKKKNIENKIKEYADNNSILNGTGFGISFQKIIKKGNIDYSQIKELSSVNTELYRKKPTIYYKITTSEE